MNLHRRFSFFTFFRLLSPRGIFLRVALRFSPCGLRCSRTSSLRSSSNPPIPTILNTYPQEFMTFADFLLYVVKCCKNQPIAVEITAFLRHDYGTMPLPTACSYAFYPPKLTKSSTTIGIRCYSMSPKSI